MKKRELRTVHVGNEALVVMSFGFLSDEGESNGITGHSASASFVMNFNEISM